MAGAGRLSTRLPAQALPLSVLLRLWGGLCLAPHGTGGVFCDWLTTLEARPCCSLMQNFALFL